MVSVGVPKLGVTDLIFVDPGIKVNGEYYREVLLLQELLPAIREMSGDFFVFQQDSAPAHRARDTLQLLQCKKVKVKFSHTRYRALGPELIPVYRQSARR